VSALLFERDGTLGVTMAKVITVTANTAIDRLILRGAYGPAASARTVFPAGKGINVARIAAMLGCRVVAMGLVGKNEAGFFQGVSNENLEVQLIAVDGETRINMTTCDPASGSITHERVQGFSATTNDVRKLVESVTRSMQPDDCVVISGSLPLGAPHETYPTIVARCRARGILTILDSSKDEFRLGIGAGPFMVKPNLDELQELLGRPLDPADETALATAAGELLEMGPNLVVLSRGERGIIVVGRGLDRPLAGCVNLDRPPAATGAVGSGDALVGAFAAGLVARQPLEDIVRLGIACGAANAMSLGPGTCNPADVQRLLPLVSLHRL
jgi:1-phosphofructokinase family hexose kinase